MRRCQFFVPALVLALVSATPSWAGFADGVAAYDRGDYAAAYQAWMPLANGGDPAAQRNLGHLYRFGLGVAQDFGQAAYWYREAAEAGLAGAQANLAMMYLRGQGVEEAPETAAYWFQLAATQGHAVSQYNLGLLYLSGTGVPRDEARALGWFNLAAKNGYPKALEALSRLVQTSAFQVGPPPPPGYTGGDNAGVPPPEHDRGAAGRDAEAAAPSPATDASSASPTAPQAARAEAVPSLPPSDETGQQQRLVQAMSALTQGDYATTEARLRPLARAGMPEAQYQLGMLLAEAAYAKADLAEAYVWLTLAEENGHKEADRMRRNLVPRLSVEQRAHSQELLRRHRGQS
jgi:TPR repeat protein